MNSHPAGGNAAERHDGKEYTRDKRGPEEQAPHKRENVMPRSAIVNCLLMLIVSGVAFGQVEKPLTVSVCDLKKNPDAYNHQVIQIQGTVSHEFEDFSLHDAMCPEFENTPWLMYGGDVPDDVTYCCNGTGNKNRVNVEGIEVPLRKDPVPEQFTTAHEFVSHQQKSEGPLFSN